MRRRDPDELTDREREVLALLRRDFTNEQIAERLGISLDGAKYHVSQILSKLAVATREDAAAWRPKERPAWWARWPLWAKIAGAATMAVAVAGLALLVWGVLRTSDDTEVQSLSENSLYGRMVYLAPQDRSAWIAPPEQVVEAGILVAATAEEFRAAVTAETAVIMIDRDWVSQVDKAWVRGMLTDGKVLVGARVNLSDLTAAFGGASAGQHAGYPPSRLFYSLVSQHSCAVGEWQSGGAASDYLDRNQRGQFRLLIARLVQHSQNQCVDFLGTASDVNVQASCVMPSAIPASSQRSLDDIFAAIAREVPGFAGFYFAEDGRTLIAVLKEPVSEPDALCQSMARQSGMARLANLSVRSVYAQYSFLELQGWYRPVQEALSIPGVVRSDIDEVRNRIVIGVETDEAREAVAQMVEELGIPTEAVIIEHAEPAVAD